MDIAGVFNSVIEWLRDVWNKINIKEWSESLGGTSSEAVHAAIYFGVGFAIGFLFKKYFKLVFFSLLFAVLIILLLQYNRILDIDWEAFNVLLGFEPAADAGVMMNTLFDWVKANFIISISSLVGFLIGYKLG